MSISSRVITLLSLTLVLALACVSHSQAAYYRGGGPGIRVEFRIQHHSVAFGRIATSQYCETRAGERFKRQVRVYFGPFDHQHPPRDSTLFLPDIIHLTRDGRIDEHSPEGNTPVGYMAHFLVARVRASSIKGTFALAGTGLFSGEQKADCRTDRFWQAGSHSKRTDGLRFRAKRVW